MPEQDRRTVLITGGSSGIGLDLVHQFVSLGDQVWLTYNSGRQRAEELLQSLPEGSQAKAFEYDQGSWDSLQAFLGELPSTPDVVILNGALGTATCEKYVSGYHLQSQALMQVNVVGPLWLTEALLPKMQSRGSGKLVYVSSVGGGISVFTGMRLADGTSKAALAFLARQVAALNVHTGVDVFCIAPGATDTPMFQASTLNRLSPAERAQFEEGLAQKRLIPPSEIAQQIVFLCSPAARSMHGAVIDSSAGLGVRPGLVEKKA